MKRTLLKPGRDTGSLTNYLYSGSAQPKPAVGMGATILMWTDRHAATIKAVTPIGVAVQEDRAIRVDAGGLTEHQEYDYQRNPDAPVRIFTLHKNGAYVERGKPMTGMRLVIGRRDEYCDPSF